MNAAAAPSTRRSTRLLCDRVLGNVAASPAGEFAGKTADPLPLTWLDCTRRAIRAQSASGRDVGILLPLGGSIAHGDVLHRDDAYYVVVEIQPCDLWLVRAASPAGLAHVALELGNLHAPVEVWSDGYLLTPPDGPTEGVLRRHSANYTLCSRRFTPLRATVTSGLSVAKGLKIVGR
jgi:urease accessory protein UreE